MYVVQKPSDPDFLPTDATELRTPINVDLPLVMPDEGEDMRSYLDRLAHQSNAQTAYITRLHSEKTMKAEALAINVLHFPRCRPKECYMSEQELRQCQQKYRYQLRF
jgi:hypothetical protein